MKTQRIALLITGLTFSAVLMATTTASKPAPAPKPVVAVSHGMSVAGTVLGVNDKTRTFVVRETNGKEVTLTWTSATQLSGGRLAAREMVDVRWMAQGGRNVATSVRIVPPAKATVPAKKAAAPAKTATPAKKS